MTRESGGPLWAGNERSGFVTREEFFDQPSDCPLLKKDSTPTVAWQKDPIQSYSGESLANN